MLLKENKKNGDEFDISLTGNVSNDYKNSSDEESSDFEIENHYDHNFLKYLQKDCKNFSKSIFKFSKTKIKNLHSTNVIFLLSMIKNEL